MSEPSDADEGGESACFAHLICPECGTVLDGSQHAPGCTRVDPDGGLEPTDGFGAGPED